MSKPTEAETEERALVPTGKHRSAASHRFTREENSAGGQKRLVSGANSRVALAPITDAKVNELRNFIREHGARWLTEADEPLLLLAARNAVVADQIWSYISQRQAMDTYGRPRGVMDFWARVNNVLSRQLTALGLGPVARAELGANVAGAKRDLAAAMRAQKRRQDEGNSAEKEADAANTPGD